jgi:hypothetical protein
MICPTAKAKYFRAHGWTVDSALIGFMKLDFWRKLPILRTASFLPQFVGWVERPVRRSSVTKADLSAVAL